MGVSWIPTPRPVGLDKETQSLPTFSFFVLEYLGLLIHEKTSLKIWKPIKASRSGPAFSHLFFVDDLILFGQAFPHTAEATEEVLTHFCHLSGQKVSNEKCRILFSRNTLEATRDCICNSLGFLETRKFDKYLGFPLKFSDRAAKILISLFKISKANWLVGKLISYL